jgi:ubiquinone/menaquinone biosynthesis C-methylase UbiE
MEDGMSKAHDAVVESQFGPRARAYVESVVHAQGEDLQLLNGLARDAAPPRALDLGCGGGHVAYTLARHAGTVTATDLSRDMLATVRATARDRNLANIETALAPAENLPFEDATFDFLASRYSVHHWRDFAAGLQQARRVLKPGAPAIFIDACAPHTALLDTHLQAIELLRDTSHTRNYSAAEWLAALSRAGFRVSSVRTWRLRMDFAVWTARMRTPAVNQAAIRALQEVASDEVRTHFAIEDDGSFMLDVAMIETVAA